MYALSEEQQHTLRLTQRTSAQTRTQRHCGSQPLAMHQPDFPHDKAKYHSSLVDRVLLQRTSLR